MQLFAGPSYDQGKRLGLQVNLLMLQSLWDKGIFPDCALNQQKDTQKFETRIHMAACADNKQTWFFASDQTDLGLECVTGGQLIKQ